jgi:phosphate-selective porin OprO/OprP
MDWLARIMFTPFASQDNKWLKGMAFGGSFSWGNQKGAGDWEDAPGGELSTVTGFDWFVGDGSLNGQRTRYGAEFMWYAGPVHFNAEWLRVEQEVEDGPSVNVPVTAWYIEGGVVLTGEDATVKAVKPKNPFDPRNGKWGAVEICVRYSNADVGENAWTVLGMAGDHGRSADELAVCLNWFLNNNVKVQVMYDHTTIALYDGPSEGMPPSLTDDAIMFRFQLKF